MREALGSVLLRLLLVVAAEEVGVCGGAEEFLGDVAPDVLRRTPLALVPVADGVRVGVEDRGGDLDGDALAGAAARAGETGKGPGVRHDGHGVREGRFGPFALPLRLFGGEAPRDGQKLREEVLEGRARAARRVEGVVGLAEPGDLLAGQHAIEDVEENLHYGVEVAEDRTAQQGLLVALHEEDVECYDEGVAEVGDDLGVEVRGCGSSGIGESPHLVVVVREEQAVDEDDDLADDAATGEDEKPLGLLRTFLRDFRRGDFLDEPPVHGVDGLKVFPVDDPRRGVLRAVGKLGVGDLLAVEEQPPVAEPVHVGEPHVHLRGGIEVDFDSHLGLVLFHIGNYTKTDTERVSDG